MSEWHPQVVRVGKLGKHPNADSLSITHVLGGYQVVLRSEDWKEGDIAVFLPIDTLVPKEYVPFLDATEDGYCRIKAVKLRGLVSNGMLIPMPTWNHKGMIWSYAVGDSVVELLGLKKYERPLAAGHEGIEVSGLPLPKYDLEGLRKNNEFNGTFHPEEVVVVTEKIHGSNARYFYDDRLHVGSRTRWLDPERAGMWGTVARKFELEKKLAEFPDAVFYGEVFGAGVQDLTYGRTDQDLRFFDIFDRLEGRWLNHDELLDILTHLELPHVPTIYIGPYHSMQNMMYLAEGGTTLMDHVPHREQHVREGIVVRPLSERTYGPNFERTVLKLPGEGYLTRKEAA